MKSKGPAAAKAEEDKKKGLALFGPKPPTPKLLRAIGGNVNRNIIEKMKVTTFTFQSLCGHIKTIAIMLTVTFCIVSPRLLLVVASEDCSGLTFSYNSFLGVNVQFCFEHLTTLLY